MRMSRTRLTEAVPHWLRPDDVVLAPLDQPLDGDSVGFVAEVVDSQFGGRHMDVVIAGAHGKIARHLTRLLAEQVGTLATLAKGRFILQTGLGDGEDQRLSPLYLGYPGMVRGYEVGSYDATECEVSATSSCFSPRSEITCAIVISGRLGGNRIG